MAEVLCLGAVISLPTLAEGVVHTVVSEIVILKIKVVEVVTARFDLLSLEDTDQLRFRLLEGN